MIASPNGFAGVYDEPGAPVGLGRRPRPADLRGRTGRRRAGRRRPGRRLRPLRRSPRPAWPRPGVFSGAGEPVSAEQAAASGAGRRPARDACYHQPCDDLANANLRLARVLAAGLADFTVRVANNPELLRH